MSTEPAADRVSVFYDAIDAFQRTHRLPSLQHAQLRGLLAEHLARVVPAAVPVPPPTDRAAVLREGADALDADMERFFAEWPDEPRNSPYANGRKDAAAELRRLADEAAVSGPCVAGEQQNETPEATLAAALDGLHTLIATSSRDWGQYRVDAWLWAVLCGWDCEEGHEHDELCDDGAAMREMAEQHGWDNDTVAKARRYRSAVRAVALAAKPRP